MLENTIISREGMMLSETHNVADASLARMGIRSVTFLGTNGADVVFLKGNDGHNYAVQVRLHDVVVTKLNF